MGERIIEDIATALVDLDIEETNIDIIKDLADILLELDILRGGSR